MQISKRKSVTRKYAHTNKNKRSLGKSKNRQRYKTHKNTRHRNSTFVAPCTSLNNSKVALLFLTVGDHEQPKLWESFLKTSSLFSVYCHPRYPHLVPSSSFLHRACIPHKHCVPYPYTRWGYLVLAYEALLRFAVSHNLNTRHFVFLSDTCVPCVSNTHAFKVFASHPDSSFHDAPAPQQDKERYNYVDHKPWLSHYPHRLGRHHAPIDCSTILRKSGVLPSHFYKHSGWFTLCRRDAERILKHRDALQALNHVSAGDEHILSILKRPEYAKSTHMVQRAITYTKWDHDAKKEYERQHKLHDKKFWASKDAMPLEEQKQWDKAWQALKQKAYHPLTYDKTFTKKILQECQAANSLFVRKVRHTCNVDLLHKAIGNT